MFAKSQVLIKAFTFTGDCNYGNVSQLMFCILSVKTDLF